MTARPIAPLVVAVALASTTVAAQITGAAELPSASTVSWRELGPAPIAGAEYAGRVSAVLCSPTDADRLFVAGADGGVWRSVDGGQSWTPLTDQLPTTAIGSLANDPGDEDVLYAGTGEANYANHSRYGLGLYKSVDGGDHWVQLAADTFSGRCISRLAIDPTNTQRLYASVTRAGGFPELAAAKGHPDAMGDLGVFRSTDGGTSWTRLTGGLPDLSTHDVLLDPGAPTTLYAAVGRIFGHPDNGVYKSTNGGASWTRLTNGVPSGSAVGRLNIALAPSQPGRVYALVSNPSFSNGGGASTQGAYRTSDGGSSWTTLNIGSVGDFGWYYSLVSVSPTDPDTVFMGGLNLVRSTNAGASFQFVTPPHVDLHTAAWDASGRLVVGDDGGVHRSADLGDGWSPLNTGLGTIQFYAGLSRHPTDDRIVFGGTQDNGSNRRTTDTPLWTQVFGGDGGWTQIDPTDPDRVFVEFQGSGNLYRSTDGGDSFSFAGSGIDPFDRHAFLPPFLIDPTNPSRMLYGTQRVYRSLDGGSSWSPLSGDLDNGSGAIRALAMAPSDPSVVWAATNDGNVSISMDGGQTFQLRLSGIPGWPRVTREIHPHPDQPLTAWLAVAAFGTEQIRRTDDGGQSWTPLDQNLPDVPVNVVAVVPGPPDRIYAGTDSGLLVSPDGGQTWARVGIDTPRAPVIDILLRDDGRVLVATQGRGAWEALPSLEAREAP